MQTLLPNCSAGNPGWSKEGGCSQSCDAAAFAALPMSLYMSSIKVYPIHARKTLPNTSLCLKGMIQPCVIISLQVCYPYTSFLILISPLNSALNTSWAMSSHATRLQANPNCAQQKKNKRRLNQTLSLQPLSHLWSDWGTEKCSSLCKEIGSACLAQCSPTWIAPSQLQANNTSTRHCVVELKYMYINCEPEVILVRQIYAQAY